MSPLAKSLFATLSVAVVVAATLSLRGKPAPAPHAQLTQAQLAEMAPPAAASPAPRMSAPVNDPADLPPPPADEPDLEDGNGS